MKYVEKLQATRQNGFNFKRMSKIAVMIALALISSSTGGSSGQPTALSSTIINSPNLNGVGVFLPHLLESRQVGDYGYLIHVIGENYPEGTIDFKVVPVTRALLTVEKGRVDFAFPMMKLRPGADVGKSYRFTTESVGKVTFVLYSNVNNKLTKEDLIKAFKSGKPYSVEAGLADWGFPTKPCFYVEAALRKIELGRIDGLLWAQEEVDWKIRELQLTHIHRAHFDDFDEVLMVPRTSRGDFVEKALSGAIRGARDNGSLQKAFNNVHHSYDDWQPSQE